MLMKYSLHPQYEFGFRFGTGFKKKLDKVGGSGGSVQLKGKIGRGIGGSIFK